MNRKVMLDKLFNFMCKSDEITHLWLIWTSRGDQKCNIKNIENAKSAKYHHHRAITGDEGAMLVTEVQVCVSTFVSVIPLYILSF